MSPRLDEATANFLGAATDDLQRQAGRTSVIEHIAAEPAGELMTLVATVRVGVERIEVRGSGDSLLTAYASLTRALPEGTLASAFRALVLS